MVGLVDSSKMGPGGMFVKESRVYKMDGEDGLVPTMKAGDGSGWVAYYDADDVAETDEAKMKDDNQDIDWICSTKRLDVVDQIEFEVDEVEEEVEEEVEK